MSDANCPDNEQQIKVLNAAFGSLTKTLHDIRREMMKLSNKMDKLEKLQEKQNNEIWKEMNILKSNIKHGGVSAISEEEEIKLWMTDTVKLPQYIDNFLQNGYDSFDIIKEMDVNQLIDIDIVLKGHQFKLQHEILKLRENNDDKLWQNERWNCQMCDNLNVGNTSCSLCGIQKGGGDDTYLQNNIGFEKVEGAFVGDTLQ